MSCIIITGIWKIDIMSQNTLMSDRYTMLEWRQKAINRKLVCTIKGPGHFISLDSSQCSHSCTSFVLPVGWTFYNYYTNILLIVNWIYCNTTVSIECSSRGHPLIKINTALGPVLVVVRSPSKINTSIKQMHEEVYSVTLPRHTVLSFGYRPTLSKDTLLTSVISLITHSGSNTDIT